MSRKSLPSQGREREIFLRALRAYSEECPEPPVLHADCPFAISTSGGRTCFEECRDILAEFEVPPRSDEITLGDGLVMSRVVQPRARRPNLRARPYDSLEILRLEEHLPLEERSLGALLRGLQDLVEQIPIDIADDRFSHISQVADVLQKRGFDAADIVRHGMTEAVVAHILVMSSAPWLADKDAILAQHAVRWAALLDQVAPGLLPQPSQAKTDSREVMNARFGAALTSDFRRLVRGWAADAALEDLIRCVPPLDGKFLSPSRVDADRRDRIRWMTERFTQTYLTEWNKSSLHLEWKYIHSQEKPPCVVADMRRRTIPEGELAREIANRMTDDRQSDQHNIAHQLVEPALQFVQAGRLEEAAALFEAVRSLDPADPAAQNNYGFCILPIMPELAITALEHSSRLGYKPTVVNVGNRLLALYRLGRIASALDLADHSYEMCVAEKRSSATMWDYSAVTPQLIYVDDMRQYTIGLALRIARESGVAELAELWTRRYEGIPAAPG